MPLPSPEHRAAAARLAALLAAKTQTDTYGGEYDEHISADYWADIYEAVRGYLGSSGSVTKFRNDARKAVVNAFPPAFYSGYADAGGEETEDDDEAWLTARINEELVHIDELFAGLKDRRSQAGLDVEAEAGDRADGYRKTLNMVYTQGKMRGDKNRTLVFDGEDGEESCPECQELKGKRRTIKWILANNKIPAPGNDAFTCQGYRCQHYWADPKTGERYAF